MTVDVHPRSHPHTRVTHGCVLVAYKTDRVQAMCTFWSEHACGPRAVLLIRRLQRSANGDNFGDFCKAWNNRNMQLLVRTQNVHRCSPLSWAVQFISCTRRRPCTQGTSGHIRIPDLYEGVSHNTSVPDREDTTGRSIQLFFTLTLSLSITHCIRTRTHR